MNLRVDLIFETEQRSASVVNMKSLVRIVSIVVPVIIVVIIAMVTGNMMRISSELKNQEAQMAIAGPRRDAAIAFRGGLDKNKQTLEDLEGWRLSRILWNGQLASLQALVPIEIQLTSLRFSYSVDAAAAGGPTRNYLVAIKGKAYGAGARANVETLGALAKNASFTNFLKESSVVSYTRNEELGAKEGEMLFQVDGAYKPRKFK